MKSQSRLIQGAFTVVELLIVIAIVALLIAMLVPAVQKVRAAAARTECASKIKQIGTALNNYYDTYGHFPARQDNAVDLNRGPDFRQWMYRILPYIDQEALFKEYETTNDRLRTKMWSTIIPAYLCPADPRENAGGSFSVPQDWNLTPNSSLTLELAMTSYAGVNGSEFDLDRASLGVGLGQNLGTTRAQITDGLANTLMLGEQPPSPDGSWGWWAYTFGLYAINGAVPYWDSNGDSTGTPCADRNYFSPGDLTDFCHTNHFWSFHPGGGNWLLCDGSVRFMDYSAGTTVIPAMATMAGGEVIPPMD